MKNLSLTLCALGLMSSASLSAQKWQQRVSYKMDIQMDVQKHQFEGQQQLWYVNNSPDTIKEVFYHLYFNAFQGGSMMDTRSRHIEDPDRRVGDRIVALKADEVGYQQVNSLTQAGEALSFRISETLLHAELAKPLAPGDSTLLEMQFRAQVPVQIRRSGRNNAQGVDYTMTQWYPKMAAYDADGWHPDPYVAREFYAPFGRFEVRISLDRDYLLGGTGVLQNKAEHFSLKKRFEHYSEYKLAKSKEKKRTWHFIAENVHDFAWAADEDFRYIAMENMGNIPDLNFYFLPEYDSTWSRLPKYTAEFFRGMNAQFGRYKYPQFSVIQGGDGGMEYPMCTMLKGTGKMAGLVGVMVHESAHNWYYGMLASNENQYPWMDEGFTTFAENEILADMGFEDPENPHGRSFLAYSYLVQKGEVEPLSTPADYFSKNRTYSISAYSRGCLFLVQLRYIMGEEYFQKTMLNYYDQWALHHPDPWDFIRVAENSSGLQLDWYLNFWLNTTKYIDYAVDSVYGDNQQRQTQVVLKRIGEMPMPIRLLVRYTDGSSSEHYIPLVSQFADGQDFYEADFFEKAWPWTHPEYVLNLEVSPERISKIVIDPKGEMADVQPTNDLWSAEEEGN